MTWSVWNSDTAPQGCYALHQGPPPLPDHPLIPGSWPWTEKDNADSSGPQCGCNRCQQGPGNRPWPALVLTTASLDRSPASVLRRGEGGRSPCRFPLWLQAALDPPASRLGEEDFSQVKNSVHIRHILSEPHFLSFHVNFPTVKEHF